MSARKQYTDAQKAAYYKKKSLGQQRPKTVIVEVPSKPVRRSRVARARRPKEVVVEKVVEKPMGAFEKTGSEIGSFLGGKLGHLVGTVTGFGDYHVDQNSILKGGLSPPQIVNSVDKGGVIVRHREFIGNILATTAFTVQSYLIQPGLAESFPWLSQIANAYEQYRLRGMIFEFKTTSSDALLSTATSTALGSVIMSTDYDVADPIPTSKRQMLNSEYSCSSKPSETFVHLIECKKSVSPQSMLYTRGSLTVPANFDQRLYDFARFHIATEGMQVAGGVLGELWVTYEIELFKQQFSYFGQADHFRSTLLTAARPLGTVSGSNIGSGGTIGGQIAGDALSYAFPRQISSGKYLWVYAAVGGGAPNVAAPTVTFTNASGYNILFNDTLSQTWLPNPPVAANQIGIQMCGVIQVTAEGAYINFSNTGVMPGPTNGLDFFVVRLPDQMGPL